MFEHRQSNIVKMTPHRNRVPYCLLKWLACQNGMKIIKIFLWFTVSNISLVIHRMPVTVNTCAITLEMIIEILTVVYRAIQQESIVINQKPQVLFNHYAVTPYQKLFPHYNIQCCTYCNHHMTKAGILICKRQQRPSINRYTASHQS